MHDEPTTTDAPIKQTRATHAWVNEGTWGTKYSEISKNINIKKIVGRDRCSAGYFSYSRDKKKDTHNFLLLGTKIKLRE